MGDRPETASVTTHPIVQALRAAIRASGDPARAVAQQKYMKSEMPYRGITSGELTRLVREVLATTAFPPSREEWVGAVRSLWDDAEFREERYAATTLAQHRSAKTWQDPAALALHKHLIVTGAWWDHVDTVTSKCVSPILAAHRPIVTPIMRAWAVSDDLWLRRASIISQLPHRERTDTDLLTEAILANVEGTAYGREFFVRKAIGWSLRQYARTDAEWVEAFVAEHGDRLSGLSRREALKHL